MMFGVLVIERRANQLAAGLSLMFFGFGASTLIGRPFVGALVAGLPRIALPGLGPFDVLVWLAVPTALLALGAAVPHALGPCAARGRRGPGGRLRRRPPPKLMQYQALALGGVSRRASAARISRWRSTQTWDEGMTAGRGFIAIALVIFARWNPLWADRRRAGVRRGGGAATATPGARRRCLAVPDDDGSLSADPADPGVLGLEPALRRARRARPQFLRRGVGRPDPMKRRRS